MIFRLFVEEKTTSFSLFAVQFYTEEIYRFVHRFNEPKIMEIKSDNRFEIEIYLGIIFHTN